MLPVQCKMARAALGLGARELAAKAGVSPETVFRLEKGEVLHQRTGTRSARHSKTPASSSSTRMAEGRASDSERLC
jgi:Helix-turn-helix